VGGSASIVIIKAYKYYEKEVDMRGSRARVMVVDWSKDSPLEI
jgi:hypothetical protein